MSSRAPSQGVLNFLAASLGVLCMGVGLALAAWSLQGALPCPAVLP